MTRYRMHDPNEEKKPADDAEKHEQPTDDDEGDLGHGEDVGDEDLGDEKLPDDKDQS